jgi:Zn finger protein HypA/HybF involved in hydrogenase expression
MGVTAFQRNLEQELQALIRGVSLECLVCGEFVLHAGGMITCPECGSTLRAAALDSSDTQLQFDTQTG